MNNWRIIEGDCRDVLRVLPAQSVHTVVTSPPYFGLRDYGTEGQIGLEPTPDEFVAALVEVFRGVRRVLRDDGTIWLNLGDSYAGSWGAQSRPNGTDINSTLEGGSMLSARQIEAHPRRTQTGSLKNTPGAKAKDLLGIPWMVAFALRADGWYLRSDIIWSKPNPMPESVTDRPTKSHEYVFLLAKSARYYFDADAIREEDGGATATPYVKHAEDSALISAQREDYQAGLRNGFQPGAGRNKRSVWHIATAPYAGAHFATFPPKLIEPCILAGAPERACGECGAPWVRQVAERGPSPEFAPLAITEGAALPRDGRGTHRNMGGRYQAWLDANPKQTLGFEPSCSHDDGSASGVVLDPFAGAGTTGLVALRHNRSFIGIELSPTYAAMARERIIGDAPLLNSVGEMVA